MFHQVTKVEVEFQPGDAAMDDLKKAAELVVCYEVYDMISRHTMLPAAVDYDAKLISATLFADKDRLPEVIEIINEAVEIARMILKFTVVGNPEDKLVYRHSNENFVLLDRWDPLGRRKSREVHFSAQGCKELVVLPPLTDKEFHDLLDDRQQLENLVEQKITDFIYSENRPSI